MTRRVLNLHPARTYESRPRNRLSLVSICLYLSYLLCLSYGKKFIGQIDFILSRTTSCICRFFCIEHLYAGGFHKVKLYLSYEFFSYDRHHRYNDMETRLYQAMFFADDLAQFVNLEFNWILLRWVNRPYIFFSSSRRQKKTTKLFIFIQVVPFKWKVFILASRQENENRQMNENTRSWKATCNAVRLLFNKNTTGKVTPHTLKWMRNWRRYNLQKHYIWK